MDQLVRQFYTIHEFSGLKSLSVSTVRRRIKDRSIPFEQPGGRGKKILIPAWALQPSLPIPEPSLRAEKPIEYLEAAAVIPEPRTRSGPEPKWRKRAKCRQ